MLVFQLKPGTHKGDDIIILDFDYDRELIDLVKIIPDAKWSRTMKSWYIPHTSGALDLLLRHFKGKAWLDYTRIRFKGQDRPGRVVANRQKIKSARQEKPTDNLSPEIKKEINGFTDWMRNKRYSESTIKTYTGSLQLFFRFLENKPLGEIENEDLERFNKEYIIARQYSVSFQSQVINAVKLFFSIRQKRKLDPEIIHRPKKPKLLPNVLSKEEIKQILEAHKNIKHRAMLSLIYACGLRRGELLNVRIPDVDSKRGLLIIRQGKGKKDRIVPLSEKMLSLLREYYKYEKPVLFLFEGEKTGERYSETSLQKVLKASLKKAGIKKPVTLHWLWHSYATHLLENGTDLRYIQELLGHNSSRTTEIYTHVSNNSLKKIKSPFDDL